MDVGIFSGIAGAGVGGLIGLLGAAFGIYCSIKNTNGPRERAFMIKSAVWTCVGLVLFFVLMGGLFVALPHPYKPWSQIVWLLFVPGLVISIVVVNRGQARIRKEEANDLAQDQNAEPVDDTPPPVN